MHPDTLKLLCHAGSSSELTFGATVEQWLDAAQTDGKPALRSFQMIAYTGSKMNFAQLDAPVIIDIQGMSVTNKPRPILKDHQRSQIVGHTTSVKASGRTVLVDGVVSGTSPAAREVVDTSRNGFPWQASVGVSVQRMEHVKAGSSAQVNGEVVNGPVYIARATSLNEISFVALGADDRTTAAITAAHNAKGLAMDFEAWLSSLGLQASALNADQLNNLKSVYAKINAAKDGNAGAGAGLPAKDGGDAGIDLSAARAQLDKMVADAIAPIKKMAKIQEVDSLCAAAKDVPADKLKEIKASALAHDWSPEKVELELVRSGRPTMGAPSIGRGGPSLSAAAIECALTRSTGKVPADKLEKIYGPQVLEAADKLKTVGLRDLCRLCCNLEHKDIPMHFGDGREVIEASFSTHSLVNIFENSMTKVLLQSYEAVAPIAPSLCSTSAVSDFKQVSRYRVAGTGDFEKVGPTGELKQGDLSEQKFTNQAETYGQMLTLTRQDIINDDLGALTRLAQLMGIRGAQKVDDVFFAMWLANAGSFFATGGANDNLLTGAGTVFSDDALNAAEQKFMLRLAGPNNRGNTQDQSPIMLTPTILLVPPALKREAERLIGSPNIVVAGGSNLSKVGIANPYYNKYRIVVAPHLQLSGRYSGTSATAWYLLADPQTVSAAEIVYLNNVRTPTLERVDPPANVLGVTWRAYLDFGVNFADPFAAVKSAGA